MAFGCLVLSAGPEDQGRPFRMSIMPAIYKPIVDYFQELAEDPSYQNDQMKYAWENSGPPDEQEISDVWGMPSKQIPEREEKASDATRLKPKASEPSGKNMIDQFLDMKIAELGIYAPNNVDQSPTQQAIESTSEINPVPEELDRKPNLAHQNATFPILQRSNGSRKSIYGNTDSAFIVQPATSLRRTRELQRERAQRAKAAAQHDENFTVGGTLPNGEVIVTTTVKTFPGALDSGNADENENKPSSQGDESVGCHEQHAGHPLSRSTLRSVEESYDDDSTKDKGKEKSVNRRRVSIFCDTKVEEDDFEYHGD